VEAETPIAVEVEYVSTVDTGPVLRAEVAADPGGPALRPCRG